MRDTEEPMKEAAMSFARTFYQAADQTLAEPAPHPHQIVLVTLRELTRALDVLATAQAQGRAFPPAPLNRALTAIYILQSSLDFEAGGQIADDLFQLYEFTRFHLLKAWRGEAEARLPEARDAMDNILSAWGDIAPDANKVPA
ncbi:MAG: flagellar protein FliS [Pseudomonadota bacterium]